MSEQGAEPAELAGLPVVRPPVEIDVANAEALRADLLAASPTGRDTLVVDMTDTAFCDSTGLNVLVRAHKRLEGAGGELRLVIREPTLLRIFTVTGMTTMFHIFGSLDDALAGPQALPRPAERP